MNEWYAVFVVSEDFKVSQAVAIFRDEQVAIDWGRDCFPYAYVIRPWKLVPDDEPKWAV